MPSSSVSFFSQSPMFLENIYSHLNSEADFLKAWKINKNNQRAVELALFNKNDIKFYPAQIKILSAVINFKASLINGNRVYINELCQNFFAKLSNSQLCLSERLQGLKLIGNVKGLPVDLSLIRSALNKKNKSDRRVPLNCLALLIPALEKKAIQDLVKLVKANLENKSTSAAALSCMAAMVPFLEREELASLSNVVKKKLDNSKKSEEIEQIEEAALICLEAMASRLNKKTLSDLVELVIEKLYRPSSYNIQNKARDCLVAMVPALEKKVIKKVAESLLQKTNEDAIRNFHRFGEHLLPLAPLLETNFQTRIVTFIQSWIEKIIDAHWNFFIQQDASNCLVVLVPALKAEIQIRVFNWAKRKLNDPSPFICRDALACLAALVPSMKKKQLPSLFKVLEQKLKAEVEVSRAAFALLAAMVPILKKEVPAIFINAVSTNLNSPNTVVSEAINCGAVMALFVERERLMNFLDAVTQRLQDANNELITEAALNFLAKTAPLIEKDEWEKFTKLVQPKLTDKYPSVRRAAVNCLVAMPCAVEESMVVTLVKSKIDTADSDACLVASTLLTAMRSDAKKEALLQLVDFSIYRLQTTAPKTCRIVFDFLGYILLNHPQEIQAEIDAFLVGHTGEELAFRLISEWVTKIELTFLNQPPVGLKTSVLSG